MSETGRRTDKLAGALHRSGHSVAPVRDEGPRRQAMPMNGPIVPNASPDQTSGPAPSKGPSESPGRQPVTTTPAIDPAVPSKVDPARPAAKSVAVPASAGSQSLAKVRPARAKSEPQRHAGAPLRDPSPYGRWAAAVVVLAILGAAFWALRTVNETAEGPVAPVPVIADQTPSPPVSPERPGAQDADPDASNDLLAAFPATGDVPVLQQTDPAPAEPALSSTLRRDTTPDLATPSQVPPVPEIALPPVAGDQVSPAPQQPRGPARPVPAEVPLPVAVAQARPLPVVTVPPSQVVTAEFDAQPAPVRVAAVTLVGTVQAPPAPEIGAVFDEPHRIIIHYNASNAVAETEATRIAADLTAAGAAQVQVATVSFGVSATHVRQYYSEDVRLAAIIAQTAGPDVEVRDFTDYRPRPTPGLIELWLGLN